MLKFLNLFALYFCSMTSRNYTQIFQQCILDYHVEDNVDALLRNPYAFPTIESLLYHKSWIDTVQWHLEDIIRNPNIEPSTALHIKRRIDFSNQQRTDMVEKIDDWFLQQYNHTSLLPDATLNTESPAWAIDRLSILELKIFHMAIEASREDATKEHRERCAKKLAILFEQQDDLSLSIDQLVADIAAGNKKMKVYRQMKMYNDASLNPILYHQKVADL